RALLEEGIAGDRRRRPRRLACHAAQGGADADAGAGDLARELSEALVAQDLDVGTEELGLVSEVELARAPRQPGDRLLGDVERALQHADVERRLKLAGPR